MRGNAGGSSAGTPRTASRARAARRFSGPEDPAGAPSGDQDGSQQARTSAAHHVCRHGAPKQGECSPTDCARWHRGTRFAASRIRTFADDAQHRHYGFVMVDRAVDRALSRARFDAQQSDSGAPLWRLVTREALVLLLLLLPPIPTLVREGQKGFDSISHTIKARPMPPTAASTNGRLETASASRSAGVGVGLKRVASCSEPGTPAAARMRP